ncbi:MAG: asparagine N-glycosylation enzyme membrane subunit Stt3 [Myxococcota bacterium]|jgi:asparagine N-glycosylation enzyme membrane subunit Stt3
MTTTSARTGWEYPALLGVMLFALGVRALGFEHVFTDEGVVFAPADATYHMRRAFYTFVNFPSALLHDPLLNFPGGANVPWPPLFDFLVGGTARLFAEDQAGFERVGAWASSVFGAITVVPIYFIARQVAGAGVGLFAGFLFSLFPMCVKYGRVGNPDHHTAVAFVGACLLLLCTHLARRDISDRRIIALAPAMVVVRLAMFLIWHGNLLYMAFFEATILLTSAATRRNAIIRAQAVSALFTAVFLSPIIAEFLPVPIGGPYSSISLSRLHVLVMIGTSFVAFSHWLVNKRAPDSGFVARIFAMASASAAFVAFLFVFPPTREGLVPALQFLTMRDGAGLATLEQLPLFAIFGRDPVQSPEHPWAYFAYIIPLAPLAFPLFVRDPARRASAWVLTGWTTGFALLAMSQRRYGNDFAPAAAVAFAIGLVELPRWILRKAGFETRPARRGAMAVSIMVALGLFSSVLQSYEIPRLRSGFATLRGEPVAAPIGMDRISKNMAHFARKVRAATPDTEGFLNQRRNPEYGVIAHANLGHLLHYYGRRATATDPMWSYIGPENWARSAAFYRASDEKKALGLASVLKGRFVVTADTDAANTVAGRLHQRDGRSSQDTPRLEHFRLVTESSPGRAGFGVLFDQETKREDQQSAVSYKLFEVVPGAVLEINATKGTRVSASVTIEAPSGRSFVYTASDTAGDDGAVHLRVPYATGGSTPIRAKGPYRIVAGFNITRVDVNEADVLGGATVGVRGFHGFTGGF